MSANAELRARALRVLPLGTSSSVRALEQDLPLFVARAEGAYNWDEDGARLIDYVNGMGAILFGHAHKPLVAAMTAAIAAGVQHAGGARAEVEAAEGLTAAVPACELVRFMGSATEAVTLALSIARTVTGRPTVVKFTRHYHGWIIPGDPAIPPADAANAAPETVRLPWNDAAALEAFLAQRGAEVAAVITEPLMANRGCFAPEPDFLAALAEAPRRAGALLIVDETITGLRLALGGAQALFGLPADLSIFGKALAGGPPIGALGGRAELMAAVGDGRVFHGGTFNAWTPTMECIVWTLAELTRLGPDFQAALAAKGRRLMAALQAAADRAGVEVRLRGPGPVFWLGFAADDNIDAEAPVYARFRLAMRARGVRIIPGGRWYVSVALSEDDIAATAAAAEHAFRAAQP